MKLQLILLFISISTGLFCQKTDTLSLEKLLQLAEYQSIEKAEASLNKAQATLNYTLFKSTLKPQISINGVLPNYTKTFSQVIQPNGSLLFQPITNNNSSIGLSVTQAIAKTGGTLFLESDLRRFDDFENSETRYNGAPVRLGIIQPLFGFNALKWDKRIEPLRFEAAQKAYYETLETMKVTATNLYFNLLTAYTDLKIAQFNKESNQTLFSIATEKKELGKISERDLVQLKLELVSAQRNEKRALQAVKQASAELCSFLGTTYEASQIVPVMPVVDSVFISLEEALRKAKLNRSESNTFERLLLEAERNVEEAKRTGGVQANLVASFGFVRGADQLGDIYGNPQQEQFAQIQFNMPILDWGQQKSRVGLQKAQQEYTQKWVQQAKITFENRVQQTVEQFNALQQEVAFVKEIQAIAEQRFLISKESYVLGAISITELTFAQRERDIALRQYVEVLSQYWTTYFNVRQLTLFDFMTNQEIIKK